MQRTVPGVSAKGQEEGFGGVACAGIKCMKNPGNAENFGISGISFVLKDNSF